MDNRHGGGVRPVGLFPTAQDRGIAGFQAQGGNVNGDVWARFINYANHAQRDATTLQTQTAVQQPTVNHLPDRVGEITHLAYIVSTRFQTRWRQGQAVEHRIAQAVGSRLLNILYVCAEDAFGLRFQLISNGFQYAIFFATGEQRQLI
ncbi:hypothetical protein SDC9_203442 [bioreactor metagenome]|uniref:Uncharacterized protein n=1 Tax=bioreactor metagenome TaxID=1076179 RepID=A0A645IWH3_9ZZZZ